MGKYRVILTPKAQKDLSSIKRSGDNASIKKAELIIAELSNHPETGTGKPERLKFDLAGFWSRRLNKKDRLVYTIEEQIVTVTVVAALGHYGEK
jgi:toxin YoeB